MNPAPSPCVVRDDGSEGPAVRSLTTRFFSYNPGKVVVNHLDHLVSVLLRELRVGPTTGDVWYARPVARARISTPQIKPLDHVGVICGDSPGLVDWTASRRLHAGNKTIHAAVEDGRLEAEAFE